MRALSSRRLFPAWRASAPTRLQLMAYNGCNNANFNYGIGLAASWDGVTWTKISKGSPAIAPGTGWESALVKDPMLLKIGPGDYRMWYAGANSITFSSAPFNIGYATSPDGVTWTKSGSNPVLTPSVSGWDSLGVEGPTVLYEPSDISKPFKMWYAGSTGSNSEQQVGYAYSSDGINWTKYSGNPVLTVGGAGSYDAVSAIPFGGIIKVSGTYYLFYTGRASTGPTVDAVCLATFTDPEGTYTKSASNPLLSPSAAFQALTADLTAGTAVVHVASTAAFHAGEPCMLGDSSASTTDVVIQTIDSGTQMTLKAPPPPPLGSTVPYTWATANSAAIASLYHQAVDPRTVMVAENGSGYVMYISPFDQFGDGGIYRERAAAAVSSSLTSGWSFDYTRGLVLPLGPNWDPTSAENPSVIVE